MYFEYFEGALAETVRHKLYVMAAFWAPRLQAQQVYHGYNTSAYMHRSVYAEPNNDFLRLSKTGGQPVSQAAHKTFMAPCCMAACATARLHAELWRHPIHVSVASYHAHRIRRPLSLSVVVFALLRTTHWPCMSVNNKLPHPTLVGSVWS